MVKVNANKNQLRRRLLVCAAPKSCRYAFEAWKTVIRPSTKVNLTPRLKREKEKLFKHSSYYRWISERQLFVYVMSLTQGPQLVYTLLNGCVFFGHLCRDGASCPSDSAVD